ncbi:MAG: winged helix-turn-helix domain-containing protein [Candidatus Dormibacteraeota bacterium]|uniref:Winged helix-turn-helix domain-containing protein n=1 Tax=Candidatus Aeolococcus gillhamiae TaxID=3127015 RepID=A0A934N565_9BACT|nr:winged helix-turn-helix domain-containing protein [Candidatus Dormibacteraeota bacterium]
MAETTRGGSLGDVVNRYLAALFGQISQAVACNRLHSSEERLSRWLLMTHDRVGRDHFAITHESLSQMLGSSRVTVTLSAGALQTAGLIEYRRRQLSILNRSGLQQVACECYAVIRYQLDRVLAGVRQFNELVTPAGE